MFSAPRWVVGTALGQGQRAQHLRLVFLGLSQNGHYYHSVRELMVVSGVKDAHTLSVATIILSR